MSESLEAMSKRQAEVAVLTGFCGSRFPILGAYILRSRLRSFTEECHSKLAMTCSPVPQAAARHAPFSLFGPSLGHELFDLPVRCRCRQSREEVPQIGERIESSSSAGFDDRVDNRTALAGFGFAEEEPVLLAQRRRPDRVLDLVIVDLQAPVAQVNQERVPFAQRVGDRFAHQALGQKLALLLPTAQGAAGCAR